MLDQDIVFQSYGRCCKNDAFYVAFYDNFMNSSEEIRDMFKNTDMKQQRHLLRNGIMQLILFARGMPDSKLKALGESHSRGGYNIQPRWYRTWEEALIKTLREHDREFDETVEGAWRRVITPGIELMKGAY